MPCSMISFCCLSTSSCSGMLELLTELRELDEPPWLTRLRSSSSVASTLPTLPETPTLPPPLPGPAAAALPGLAYRSLLHSSMHLSTDTRHSRPLTRMDFS
uniref:Putative secreted protein n=1 Tax=Ixodes ricinus TaxID=34613 RepID=A0A6B0UBU4_IXORI